jgi:plasmid stabilization system protein ParE
MAHAKAQLRHIHNHIAQDSPRYARHLTEGPVQKTTGLDELPRKGKRVSELNDEAVRKLPMHSYRILYEIKPDNLIEVLAVIHKRRDLQPGDVPRDL